MASTTQSVNLKAAGIYTHPNNLSAIPEGALTIAENVVIDRNSVLEPRRGFAQYGNTFGIGTDRIKQLMTYKRRLLRHFNDTIQFDSDGVGTFLDFDGSYIEPAADIKIKYIEANGNFYFTTNEGIKKISAATAADFTTAPNFIVDAGAPQGLDVTGVVDYTTAGFFTDKSKVAYRIVWGYKDRNTNLILGAPSSRLVLTNFSDTDSGTVTLTFSIPSDITPADTQYFYQVYRTAVFQAATVGDLDDIDPGDEMNLVIEDFPTNAELIARVVVVDDITPEDFRTGGTLLYTNPVSGQGILQSNYRPPIAQDIALFKNTVFFANTQTSQTLDLALLSVADLVSGVSTITISDGFTTTTYTFVGEKEITDFTFDTQANTTDGGYFLINSASDERGYVVYFDKTGITPAPTGPDTIGRLSTRVDITAAISDADVAAAVAAALNPLPDFVAVSLGAVATVANANNGNCTDAVNGAVPVGGVFAINVVQQGDGEDAALQHVLLSAAATPSQQIDETARSLVNIINKQAGEIVNAYYLSGPDDVPGLILLQSRDIANPAFFVTADSASTGAEFSPSLPTSGSSVISDNEVEPNALFFSKYQEPEAVPIVNKFLVGPKDRAIVRILGLRDSLFILKEDAIYRLTGDLGDFALEPFDNSTVIIASDSAVILNNQIYMLSSQGVSTISDTGVTVISRPIEDQLLKVTSNNYPFKANTFAVSYESDRAYLLWTVSAVNDTDPTQCFRYNSFTNSWTKWPIAKTAAVVNFNDDRLYLAPADQNYIERERKDFTRKDYADRQFDLSIPPSAIGVNRVTLSSSTLAEPGDVILQIQYLTINQYNSLLKKLDIDPALMTRDYFSSLELLVGENLRNAVDDLAAKLDADPEIGNITFASSLGGGSSFVDCQTDFNIIVNLLNTASNCLFHNYRESEDTIDFEVLITAKVKNSNIVEVKFNMPFVQGPVILYQGIPVDVVWAPQSMGDPSVEKQVSQGTFLFENTIFFTATVAYNTDLSPDFEEIDFDRSGIGDWGTFIWSEQNWGGEGSSVPLRTYVPRDKQRCRFIRPKFLHGAAREKFSLFGISLTFRVTGNRSYKN